MDQIPLLVQILINLLTPLKTHLPNLTLFSLIQLLSHHQTYSPKNHLNLIPLQHLLP
ncbi:hypothetical protein HanXRQr2_Chr02g0077401 [Helianthus annuus]|uniref:Uncharacterized protein n=1 Tax=Helianthus annuus TaxID=4232 RepID=A0A9K3JQL0_HELAN|nr:hypothetical protein HanXRQr2_Chr02g0077401 [Helianthus annuus]